MSDKTKILVDGNCIICDWEISHYKRMHPELFAIVDISDPQFLAVNYGLNAADVIFNLHVQTPAGDFLIGVDAFAHIWGRIPKLRWASKLVKLPGIYLMAKLGYWIFAVARPYLPKKK